MGSIENLPPSDSPQLGLRHPTDEELERVFIVNGLSWRGALSIDDYLERENHLADQLLTKDGGIKYWILVDTTQPENEREILSSCETLKKRAWVAKDGKVTEVVAHGIGSVFCDPQFRGRRYAQRMMRELGTILDAGFQQEKGVKGVFSVLYSDIGKKFYAAAGDWQPRSATHIALPPVARDPEVRHLVRNYSRSANSKPTIYTPSRTHPETEFVPSHLLTTYQRADCSDLYEILEKKSAGLPGTTFMCLLPDPETMLWHHAREEFVAKRLCPAKDKPVHKGAWAVRMDEEMSSGVHVIWTRMFGATPETNVMHILRVAIRGQDRVNPNNKAELDEIVELIAAVLRRAQEEAMEWGMKEVQIWNPEPMTLQACEALVGTEGVKIVDREEESIPCLRWKGLEGRLEWIANEKFGWL